MATWTNDELSKVAGADELEVTSVRGDGSPSSARTIWVVQVGDDLYVRSVNGAEGAWYRGTQVRHQGHVEVGSVSKDVTFTDVGHDLDAQVDAAYRDKYRRYAANIIDSIVAQRAAATTMRLDPVAALFFLTTDGRSLHLQVRGQRQIGRGIADHEGVLPGGDRPVTVPPGERAPVEGEVDRLGLTRLERHPLESLELLGGLSGRGGIAHVQLRHVRPGPVPGVGDVRGHRDRAVKAAPDGQAGEDEAGVGQSGTEREQRRYPLGGVPAIADQDAIARASRPAPGPVRPGT